MKLQHVLALNLLVLLGMVPFSAALASTRIETRVHKLVSPEKDGENYQILSTVDGRIYELSPKEPQLLAELRGAAEKKLPVHLTVEADLLITGVAPLSVEELRAYDDELLEATREAATANVPPKGWLDFEIPSSSRAVGAGLAGVIHIMEHDYDATNLSSMSDADYFFNQLKGMRKHSQCYQRAHYWAYQLWSNDKVYSMKVFLFFSAKFKRSHKYKWWFHVAPFVYVNGEETVLDPHFVDEPRTMHHWTDFFMMDKGSVKPPLTYSPNCPTVAGFKDYEDNEDFHDCLLLKLPMYYYQPVDAEKLSYNGTRVRSWRESDLSHSNGAKNGGFLGIF